MSQNAFKQSKKRQHGLAWKTGYYVLPVTRFTLSLHKENIAHRDTKEAQTCETTENIPNRHFLFGVHMGHKGQIYVKETISPSSSFGGWRNDTQVCWV